MGEINVDPKNIIIQEKDTRCAPSKNYESYSCLSLNSLISMAEAYNKTFEDKIKLYPDFDLANPKKYKMYLVYQFQKRFPECKSQKCWIKQEFIRHLKEDELEELMKNTWRVTGGFQSKFEWLNTIHIDNVMEQYEYKYKDFKFLRAVPIDFDDLPQYGLKNLDLDEYKKNGKNRFGIIFNLDPHDKEGSHWVALYFDTEKNLIYFSDSYGIRPEDHICKLIRRIVRYCLSKNKVKHVVADHNKTRFQHKNSECGMYSLNFIIRLVSGETFEEIIKKPLPDDVVHACRAKYFGDAKIYNVPDPNICK